MDELISREAVFNAINRIKTKRNETWYEFYQKIMTAVGKISPAKPNWIPCSERMPKTNDPVNVTYVNHNPGNYYAEVKDKPYTATAHFHKGQWYWYSCTTQDLLDEYGTWIPDLIDKDVEILAWCNLPEPFKGVTE